MPNPTLKRSLKSLDEVSEPLRTYYTKGPTGSYLLSVDGEAEKLAEFRDNNRALNTQVTELQAKIKALEDGDSPDDSPEFEALEAKLKTYEGIDPAEFKAMKERPDLSARVAELESLISAEQTAHAQTKFNNTVSVEFLKAGGRESAVDYMVGLAAKTFTMKDGALTTAEFSPTKPGEHLTLTEWLDHQYRTAKFAFRPSSGGGATGSSPGIDPTPAKPTVSRADPFAFGQNLAAIARGDVTVE